MKRIFILPVAAVCLAAGPWNLKAQGRYWQQHIDYHISANLDVHTNRLRGTEHVVYQNHSPDTLHRVFFHLYWNAFQPGSMMDVRSRQLGKIVLGLDARGDSVRDWDPRVMDRIEHLRPDEIGYDSVTSISMNGHPLRMIYRETILEVPLETPIAPRDSASFDLVFKCQVPLQIRRSGRDNAQGVRYSMSQWYPKMSEYDVRGWHPTPYVAREFYGVWGDYDVRLTLDKDYLVGATGYLQNAGEIGYGYQRPGSRVSRPRGSTLTWHFRAPRVHDFMWAADPDYRHISAVASNDAHTVINVIYKKGDSASDANWHKLLKAALRVLPFMEKQFGPYPFRQYSFIQGGDGGMEYPMGTLIKSASLGAAFHEWMHSWYQMMLATNESTLPWMDEGFATYAEGKVTFYYDHAYADSIFENDPAGRQSTLARLDTSLPLGESGAYKGYFSLIQSGLAEPMTTHADHYATNFAYGQNAYSKGAVFLEQLGYIVGQEALHRILLDYYHRWAFKHPDANDFIRVAEKATGIKLDWYLEYWIYTTKVIDYAIDSVSDQGGTTRITLGRKGQVPMPIDLVVTYKDGRKVMHYIPGYLMFGSKANENPSEKRVVHVPWRWTDPEYTLEVRGDTSLIRSIEIDPTWRMADADRSDNRMDF